MFSRVTQFWSNYGFETLIALCIGFLVTYALYRWWKGDSGSWSSSYSYTPGTQKKEKKVPKQSSGERECRRVLEKLFNKPFISVRPDFLNNPVTGGKHNLEIDCYNEELNLGVEYQGAQHYKFNSHFHKNKEAFMNQKYRDDMKKRMCKDHGVVLIDVAYTVKVEDIERYLKRELRKRGYKV